MLNLKQQTLVKVVHAFEEMGFSCEHARVLHVLRETPLSIGEIARETRLFQYAVRQIVDELLQLQLVAYTRKGVQIHGEWAMLERLIELCEELDSAKGMDYAAAFEVVHPRVIALKKHWNFE